MFVADYGVQCINPLIRTPSNKDTSINRTPVAVSNTMFAIEPFPFLLKKSQRELADLRSWNKATFLPQVFQEEVKKGLGTRLHIYQFVQDSTIDIRTN